MSVSLIESLQKATGFSPLQKIDPDTQEVKRPEEMAVEDYLGQAAIPIVLIGIYKYTRTDEGNASFISGNTEHSTLSAIFGSAKNKVISKVATYTGNTEAFTESKMNSIALAALPVLKEQLPKDSDNIAVKNLLTAQRQEILSYLPASLQIGNVLNDETLDDRTNKMEGPVSGVMHAIGQVFSSSGNSKKEEQNF